VNKGVVQLPQEAPWLEAFVDEVENFPLTNYKDQVDAFVHALAWELRKETDFKMEHLFRVVPWLGGGAGSAPPSNDGLFDAHRELLEFERATQLYDFPPMKGGGPEISDTQMLGLRCEVLDVRDGRSIWVRGQPVLIKIMSIADQIEKIGRALTAEDLSKLLSVSKVTIFKQAAAGRIPSFRVGTCVRFDPRAVAQWLRSM